MFATQVRETVDRLLGCDPVVADHDELMAIARTCNDVRSWLDSIEIKVARRAKHLSGGPAASSAAGAAAADTLGVDGQRSRKEAKAASERSSICDRMPGFEAALANGEISAGHLDALANTTRGLGDAARSKVDQYADALLSSAKARSVAEFEADARGAVALLADDDADDAIERQRRNSRVSKWIDRTTGMRKLFAELDIESGEKVFTALDAHLDSVKQRAGNAEIALERLAVTALVELVTGQRADEPRTPEVIVHIDLQTLLDGVHEHSLCELDDGTPLPVSTVRRLCCDASIVPVVVGGDGEALDVGRAERTANRQQRRALRAMYRTCAHPHCDVSFRYCHIHHVEWWERLGLTDLANLLPLCNAHHHLVHEGGWQLTMTPDRTITLRRPDGAVHFRGNTLDRRPSGTGHDRPADQGRTDHPSTGGGRPPGQRRAAA